MPSSEYASLDLSGQVVLVTGEPRAEQCLLGCQSDVLPTQLHIVASGASSGIGEACALRFAEAGCKLIITARRTERLNDLAQRLQSTYQVGPETCVACNAAASA